MTYISRRARIISPRWPNESDTEFLFRTRRRCDGRLKRHSSSLDLRAWINNNCIKHEYLLELMSDGELYGRFIPVPLLFKLTQSVIGDHAAGKDGAAAQGATAGNPFGEEGEDGDETFYDMEKRFSGGTAETAYFHAGSAANDDNQSGAPGTTGKRSAVSTVGKRSEVSTAGKRSEVSTAGKRSEVSTAGKRSEVSTAGKRSEVSTAGKRSEVSAPGEEGNQESDSQTSLSMLLWEKDVIEKSLFRSACLLSKALGKLEKIDNIIQVADEETENMRREEIQDAFRKSRKVCTCPPNTNNASGNPCGWNPKGRGNDDQQKIRDANRCNELLRQISGLREKLKKNQECRQKVNLEIGRIKRRTESSSSTHTAETYTHREQPELRKLERKLEKLVTERGKLLSEMCEALTSLNGLKMATNSRNTSRRRSKSDSSRQGSPTYSPEQSTCGYNNSEYYETETIPCCDTLTSEDDQQSGYPCCDCSSADNLALGQEGELCDDVCGSPGGYSALNDNSGNVDFCKAYQQEKEERRKFVCQQCKVKTDADASSYDGYATSERRPSNGGIIGAVPCRPCRPTTSPTTGRERQEAWILRCCFSPNQNPPPCQNVQGRRVKSETTMKEIEKTLRNYEQRLSDMEGLEYRVEEWKKKLLEACRWRKNASKMESERDAERERSNREMHGLFSENRELKKQLRELMDQFKEQAKKIHNLKCGMMKSRDLETETEELKKELSEYRNCYEHQRKCISKWESVVALQRKEIENLMNHIRKLTTERIKEKSGGGISDRRYAQRSRSYSPEAHFAGRGAETSKEYEVYDENGSCCCQEFRKSESRRKYFDRSYYSSANGMEDWCN